MSFHKITWILEHPRRADQSAMCAINRVHGKPAPTGDSFGKVHHCTTYYFSGDGKEAE
ncbi:MAG TPA: hypothetical protein VN954_04100 [Ktedonobacteraceae bacterium]|nr:hypothetical protein [Ktedonobacteraceae bacterium]